MSIATKYGDTGQTGLAGGVRVSKSDLRVETYGTVDELNTVLGFARSICHNTEIKAWTEEVQRKLFCLGSNLATPPESKKQPLLITAEDVDWLTDLVHRSRRPKDWCPIGLCPALTLRQPHTKWPAPPAAALSARSCASSNPGLRSRPMCLHI
jgi:cob(I)alamin adenosyltransferase